jgi:hypothetical protein
MTLLTLFMNTGMNDSLWSSRAETNELIKTELPSASLNPAGSHGSKADIPRLYSSFQLQKQAYIK